MITKLEREQMESALRVSVQRCHDFVEQSTPSPWGIQSDATARKRAERLTRALQALTAVNQTLVRATGEPTLLSEVCRTICEVGG
ncbi:MAG: hypothetical protein ACRENG_35540, partial [bacterium]